MGNGMLEELDHDVERTSMNIDRETRNVMAVTRRAKNGYSMCFVGVLIILLLGTLRVREEVSDFSAEGCGGKGAAEDCGDEVEECRLGGVKDVHDGKGGDETKDV